MTKFEIGQTVRHRAGRDYLIVDIAADGGLTFEGYREMRPFDPEYFSALPTWEDIEVGDTFTFRLALTGSDFTTTEPFAGWHTVETPWGPGPGVTLVSIEKPEPVLKAGTPGTAILGGDREPVFFVRSLDGEEYYVDSLGDWFLDSGVSFFEPYDIGDKS